MAREQVLLLSLPAASSLPGSKRLSLKVEEVAASLLVHRRTPSMPPLAERGMGKRSPTRFEDLRRETGC